MGSKETQKGSLRILAALMWLPCFFCCFFLGVADVSDCWDGQTFVPWICCPMNLALQNFLESNILMYLLLFFKVYLVKFRFVFLIYQYQ